ncbi:MAG: hypothetical protein ACI97K_000219 [Glaciecola sp.]|jgi:hypothetical protein
MLSHHKHQFGPGSHTTFQAKLAMIENTFNLNDTFIFDVNKFVDQRDSLSLKSKSHLAWLAAN